MLVMQRLAEIYESNLHLYSTAHVNLLKLFSPSQYANVILPDANSGDALALLQIHQKLSAFAATKKEQHQSADAQASIMRGPVAQASIVPATTSNAGSPSSRPPNQRMNSDGRQSETSASQSPGALQITVQHQHLHRQETSSWPRHAAPATSPPISTHYEAYQPIISPRPQLKKSSHMTSESKRPPRKRRQFPFLSKKRLID